MQIQMIALTIDTQSKRPLVEQIVDEVRRHVDDRRVRPGTRLPSIRRFADAHGVSRFTAVEAYDRLVALGYLEARRGSGFYTTPPRESLASDAPAPGQEHNEALVSLIRRLLQAGDGLVLAGGAWLPNAWMDELGLRRALTTVARRPGSHVLEYGNPLGYGPLREQLSLMLSERGIAAAPGQIVLTQGTSQALDLVIRRFVRPGETVLVDDPGYYNLFGSLRLAGARLAGVPRLADGPDTAMLERLASEHRPRVYFTQSILQNPTGTVMAAHSAFRVLQLAERYDFMVVEDDIFCDLHDRAVPRLAALDQLNRVVYVRSFSKTLSGALRVGFAAARQPVADQLADVKMLSSITSSQFAERVLYAVLLDGHYRKYLGRLLKRLDEARLAAIHAFDQLGLEMFAEPEGGLFLWARFPHVENAMDLVTPARERGIVIAPGTVFRPDLQSSPWMRFNVTVCQEPRLLAWLEEVAAGAAVPLAQAAE
ncbi:GntR family transcriptional regulator [Allostella sp. ATCC 35155]|nr:GntR family transcriptional regulator [Stella sp. ATCC 35155]